MARDYEDFSSIDDLDDDELRQVVREHLAANNALDPDDVDVRVQEGVVVLSGRVGTDGERPPQSSDEAAHLSGDRGYADAVGTADVQDVIEGGTAWIPPTSPTPEGIRGTDADLGSLGEDH